jgi:PAS domain S-box-containing protein
VTSSEAILDQFSDSMIVLDAEGKIVFFNKGAKKFEHLTKTHFKKGLPFTELVSAEREDIVKNIIKQVRSNKIPQTSEAEYKDEKGHSVFLEVVFNPIVTDENETGQICVISREITHHKTFEKKSIQLLQELYQLIENANAFIFSVDSREYVTEWNKECIRVTGYEKNEVFTQKIQHNLDEQSREDFDIMMQKVLVGESVSNQELIMKTKNNRSISILVNATPKMNSSKAVVGVLFVGQDITELTEYRRSLEEKVFDRTEKLKQALEKEKELVEVKNRFVSVASHEFKIPLSSIGSAVSFLKTNTHLRKNDKVKLASIETQLTHMKKLLEDILTVKKGESHTLKATYQSLNLVDFLNRLVSEVLINTGNSHQVKINFSISPVIESDEKLLRNIFLNLLGNAIKYSPGSNEVLLSMEEADKKIIISVRDYGIGITTEDLQKIFEPFHRGSNVTDIKGTGLGLYIAKKAVETLGGAMNIASVVNTGTTITVNLPVKNNHL